MFSNKIMVNSVATPNAHSRFSPVQEGIEKFSKLALAISMGAMLAACGSDGDDAVVIEDLLDADGNVIAVPDMAITIAKPSLEAGESTDISIRFTDQNNNLITDAIEVTFSSNCLSQDLATIGGDTSTSDGALNVTYTANGCSGQDALTISANVSSVDLQASTALTIAADTVSGIIADAPEPDQLALKGIGGVEASAVTFTVRGENGAPVINETVMFSLSTTTGGISFSNNESVTTTSGVTGNDGTVTVNVYSGTANAIFRVLAEHAATGNSTQSGDITVSTGVPVASKFSMALSPFNPASDNTQGVEVSVSIISSDQYGNAVTDGTRVNFVSPESGQIESSCALENGSCSVTWLSGGDRGDYRSTIVAYTNGAEDFTDANQNNIFDGSDTAGADQPEPYADENENGSYEVGEFFVDFNSNGVRDLGDGVWNGPCLDTIDQSALCPGAERVVIADSLVILNSSDIPIILATGSFGAPQSTINLAGPSVLNGLIVSDVNGILPWGNSMPVGTTFTFATTNGTIDTGSSVTVPNNTTIGQNLAITISPDTTPSTGVLSLTITPPNGAAETVYTWVVDD
ncbi:MAG: hypothetical protein ACR2P1_11955 [Pseudomonadales bacterium]